MSTTDDCKVKTGKSIASVYPPLRERFKAVLDDANAYAAVHMGGFRWGVFCGIRTAAEQRKAYNAGRSKCDGVLKVSNHQLGIACDFVPYDAHGWTWSLDHKHWEYLGHCARLHGFQWGGDWKSFPDVAHVEQKRTWLLKLRVKAWLKGNK